MKVKMKMKRRTVIAAAVLSLGMVPSVSAGRLESYSVMCGLRAADYASTRYALQNPNVMEGNPLMRGPVQHAAVSVGTCVAMSEADHALRGHKKTRWTIRFVFIGLSAFVVTSNVGKR
jgi:hypothetical protein